MTDPDPNPNPAKGGPGPIGGYKVKIKDTKDQYLTLGPNSLGARPKSTEGTDVELDPDPWTTTVKIKLSQDEEGRYAGLIGVTTFAPVPNSDGYSCEWNKDAGDDRLYVSSGGKRYYWSIVEGVVIPTTKKDDALEVVFEPNKPDS